MGLRLMLIKVCVDEILNDIMIHCVYTRLFGLKVLMNMAGKTYRFRISNVGLTKSINFRIQGHKLVLVEVEGTHSLQNTYDSIDVHLGQSYSVLVTADQPPKDYYIVVSTRFTSPVLTTTSALRYSNSAGGLDGVPPGGPTTEIDWSINQARSLR